MKFLFFIFFFLIISNYNFVIAQISASNDNVKLEIDSNNKYASYGTTADYSLCNFKNRVIVTNIAYPSSFYGAPLDLSQNQTEFTLEVFNLESNSKNVSYKFRISDSFDENIYTDFTLYLFCEKLNISSLVIKPLNDIPIQSGYNSYYYYLSIKPLKYSLNLVSITQNIPASYTTKKINKELYLVEFTTDVQLLIDTPLMFTVLFPLPFENYSFQMKPLYNSITLQQLSSTLYPSSISTYTQYGSGFSPVIMINSNLANQSSFIGWNYVDTSRNSNGLLKVIAQTENSTTFVLPLKGDQYTQYSYSILYNNGLSFNTLDPVYLVSTFNKFEQDQLPLGLFESIPSNKLAFSFSSNQYTNEPFLINYLSFSSKYPFPFGFISGTNTAFNYKICVSAKLSPSLSKNFLSIKRYPNGISRDNTSPITTILSDLVPPFIKLFELNHLIGFKYSLKILVSDSLVGVMKLEYTNIKTITIDSSSIIQKYSLDNTYETVVDIKALINGGLRAYDFSLNVLELTKGSMIYRDSNGYPVYFDIPVPDIDLDIENVILLKNDIDILDKECYNRIYFNSSTIPHDYPLVFSLLDPVSLDDLNEGRIEPLPIVWSDQIKLFYCDFIVPKNTGPKVIKYKISTPFRDITSEALLELRVSSTTLDNDGPLISKIENANTFGKVGWRITITDQVNGFSKGYIKAIGSKDSSVFKFNFTLADVINQGTKLNGEYDIIIDVKQACASQDYSIEYIYLEDSNKRYSKYSKYESDYLPEKDPLRYLFDEFSTENGQIVSESICEIETEDTSPPEMLSFTSTATVDAFSINRYINFTFSAKDDQSGLMLSQSPKIYLTASEQVFECDSKIKLIESPIVTYSSDCFIPLGFGLGLGYLYTSVYGFINNGGYYSGYSFDADIFGSVNYVKADFQTPNTILLNYEPVYYHTKTDIVIYGRLIGNTTLVTIKYSDGTSRSYTGTLKVIGQSVIIIPKDDFNITGPFDVTAFDSSSKSTNTLRVYPIYFESTNFDPNPTPTPSPSPSPTPTITPTPTPIPTNKPQRCLGTPECGGINNGYCVENQGCVCYSPWIGNDCLSKVIIIPPPKVNDTVPSIEIPIIDKSNSTDSNNNETSTVFYKSLISIISLREISIDGKAVQGKSYNFEKWIFSTIDSNTNQYYTNITIGENIINVIATLKWFENETDIQFADQNLTMNPSSIKYTIEIKNYPFENDLNTLELVMQASFLSNSTNDSCSSKEFGETSTGDNSNYLKIQIENRSLYGRFIKRCIIDDDKILSLDNKLLDSEMNPISNTKQVQTYIGISIPQFKNNVVLDPDFSVIINPSAASSSSSNSICKNNSSKLTGSKLAGVIIGCVGFACVVTVVIVYSVYKSKQYLKMKKSIEVKLKNQN